MIVRGFAAVWARDPLTIMKGPGRVRILGRRSRLVARPHRAVAPSW
jgi:hypothetical protein